MQNKLELAIGTLPKYLAYQLFFFTYVLSIFIPAPQLSANIYQDGMFFYLFPIIMAMVLAHFGFISSKTGNVKRIHYVQTVGISAFYGFIWYALF